MTCNDCGAELRGSTRCADCTAEAPLYEAFTRGIGVPPLWDGVAARIAPDERPRRRMRIARLAAAAAIALAVAAPLVFRRDEAAADRASEHYRDAIATLERNAPAGDPLHAELTAAIDHAARAADRRPDDPVAVTRLVAAYDARLRLLREVRR